MPVDMPIRRHLRLGHKKDLAHTIPFSPYPEAALPLQGKGFFIWKIPNVEQGDVKAIAQIASQAGFTHVLVKVADGTYSYNVSSKGVDLVPPLIQALRSRDIQAWGWHYVYGYNPIGEAKKAVERIQGLQLDGYVIDAEGEYKLPGRDTAARQFMSRLRSALPTFPIGLSSYRYPTYHPQLPWKAFLEKCDFNMPQVYWMLNHNPADQLARCLREFEDVTPRRPVIPTGAAFRERGWEPTITDVMQFLQAAQSLNLPAANFYEWANCRSFLPDVWDAIAGYTWGSAAAKKDITQEYIAALNSRDPNRVTALYTPAAVHVTPVRTIQGAAAIRNWYSALFKQLLPGALFNLTSFSGTGSSRHLSWTATSSAGDVLNGSDTFGLLDDKIAYHYTFFSVN